MIDRVKIAKEYSEKLIDKTAEEIIRFFTEGDFGNIALSSSLGAEDQVLTDMIVNIDRSVKIFTLDTGRIFPETYEILDETSRHYNINVQVYFPERNAVEEMVSTNGINLFYESIEKRKLCCEIRKTEPLKRALKDVDVWITGLRKDQSVTRFFTPLVEWNDEYKVFVVNPLLKWSEKDVWKYIKDQKVPYNKLHDKGFPSIGCQPCTRAIKPGEDIRAGRWWWEAPEHKECGIHVKEK